MRFFLIDRVIKYEKLKSATGIKNVTLSEDYLADHFPGFPIYPGCLMLESMAQLCGFLLESSINTDPADIKRAMLVQADRVKFHQVALPGDQLRVHCRIDSMLEGASQLTCKITRENLDSDAPAETSETAGKVATAVLTFATRRVDIPEIHDQRRSFYKQLTRGLKEEIIIL